MRPFEDWKPLTIRDVLIIVYAISWGTIHLAYLVVVHHTLCVLMGFKVVEQGPEHVCTRCGWFWLGGR